MPEPTSEEMQRAFGEAVAHVSQEHEGGFVTKWVLLAETVGESGERGLWVLSAEDAKAWDTLGMLQYALNVELGKTIAES